MSYSILHRFEQKSDIKEEKKTNPTQKPNVSSTTGQLIVTKKKYDVMISYNWTYQSTILQIVKLLIDQGISVWMDLDEMSGNILEAMSNAIDNSDIVLICASQEYADSRNCKLEAQYSYQQNKKKIPLLFGNYKLSGWLGALIGTSLYFDYSNQKNLEQTTHNLLKELNNMLSHDTPIPSTSGKASILSTPIKESRKMEVMKWSNDQVLLWLEKNKLSDNHDQFKKNEITGETLVFLTTLTFMDFKQLCHQMEINIVGRQVALWNLIQKDLSD